MAHALVLGPSFKLHIMHNTIDIALFDDHPLLMAGLRVALEQQQTLKIMWTAADYEALRQQLNSQPVRLLIADVIAPGTEGLRLFRHLAENHPELSVIAYTSLNNLTLMRELYKLGVKGFVNKRQPMVVLTQAIEAVLEGRLYYPQTFPLPKRKQQTLNITRHKLTQREEEVLYLIMEGLLSKEIAHELKLSINTVNVHRTNLFQKFEVQNVAELIKQATYLGFAKE